jgi:hypothetical protein
MAMSHVLAGEIPVVVTASHEPDIEACSRVGDNATDA